jgi:hypothetical protein
MGQPLFEALLGTGDLCGAFRSSRDMWHPTKRTAQRRLRAARHLVRTLLEPYPGL